jgi:metallophosphoesterase (TIGR00282 family)
VKKILMVGDVVGDSGLEALESLPALVEKYGADFVVVNGENAADGFGLTGSVLNRILAAGADIVTSGNHIWEKREFWDVLEADKRVLRPANYPTGAAGRGFAQVEKDGTVYFVINLQGRDMMKPIDCPFKAFDTIEAAINATNEIASESSSTKPNNTHPIVLVDFHAESTREKESLGFYLDGRASIVAGTHTHVQTADNKILPKGAAYITDIGMTGAIDSIIGMDTKICLDRARKQILYHMDCAKGIGSIQGIIAEIDEETGKAISIERIR